MSDNINYEELYRKETGRNARGVKDSYYEKWYNDPFVNWLIQKLTHKDKLLALAEARFRAGEKLIRYAKLLKHIRLNHVQPEYNGWQQSIKDYEEAGK